MTQESHPLKIARQDRKWTMKNLADRSGISEAAISRIESRQRQPSVETVAKLALALGWPDAQWLKTWIEDQEGKA